METRTSKWKSRPYKGGAVCILFYFYCIVLYCIHHHGELRLFLTSSILFISISYSLRLTPINTGLLHPLGKSSLIPHPSSKKPKSKSLFPTRSSSPPVITAFHEEEFSVNTVLVEVVLNVGPVMVVEIISWMDNVSVALTVMEMVVFVVLIVMGMVS